MDLEAYPDEGTYRPFDCAPPVAQECMFWPAIDFVSDDAPILSVHTLASHRIILCHGLRRFTMDPLFQFGKVA